MSAFTVSIWFKPTPYNKVAQLIGKGANTTETFGVFIEQKSINKYMIYYGYNSQISGGGYYSFNNEWHEIAYAHSSLNDSLYVDGHSSGTGYGQFPSLLNTSEPIVIGSELGYQYPYNGTINFSTYTFNGTIDQVEIFNQYLSSNEISSLYQTIGSTLPPTSNPPSITQTPNSLTSVTNLPKATTSISPGSNMVLNYILDASLFVFIFGAIALSIVITYSYVKYRKNYNNEKNQRSFKTFFLSRIKKWRKEEPKKHISDSTFNLIEEIIEENK